MFDFRKFACDEDKKWQVTVLLWIPPNLRSSSGFGNQEEMRRFNVSAAIQSEAEQKAIAFYNRKGWKKVRVTSVQPA